MEVNEKELREIADLAMSGKFDKYCPIKIGDKVVKTALDPEDQEVLHPIGEKGIVRGNLHVPSEDVPDNLKSAYFVQFESDPEDTVTFIIGDKIEKI